MSDRCRVELCCRREDVDKFLPFGFIETDIDDDGPICWLVDEEANYAHCSELEELAEEGVEFWGFHDAGTEYEAAEFCSWVGNCFEVMVDLEGIPLVHVLKDGTIDEEELRSVGDYREASRVVRESFERLSAEHKARKGKE